MLVQMRNYFNCVKTGDDVYIDKHGSIYKRKSKNRTLIGKVLNVGLDSINVVIEPVYVRTKKVKNKNIQNN